LDQKVSKNLIGRGSPVTSPPYLFYWGHMKDTAYIPPLHVTLQELTGRIQGAVATVTPNMFTNVWTELE
jgi:hypothetical protein